MKLVEVAELPKVRKPKSNLQKLLKDFTESGMKCAKVTEFNHKSAKILVSALSWAITRYRLYHLKAVMRGGEVYLVNEVYCNESDTNK